MKQVRRGVFETNSSSTHSITICTLEEFEKFKAGELVWDEWNDKLIPITNENAGRCTPFKKFGEYLETYVEGFTTPSGDNMVAFGEYGYDG